MKQRRILVGSLFLCVSVTTAVAAIESSESMTVFPGAMEVFTGVESTCPTFSWQAVEGAREFELVVYELPPGFDPATGTGLDEAIEVLVALVPGGAMSWTPPLESGLTRGAEHVWFVRAVSEDDSPAESSGAWSPGRFFRVSAAPSAAEVENALQVLASYVDSGGNVAILNDESVVDEEDLSSRSADQPRRAAAAKSRKSDGSALKSVGSAITAVRGEVPDPGGDTYGVVGVSNSPGGAGFGAANTVGGPDLVLDGGGLTDAAVSEMDIDRASGGGESFAISNSGGGTIDLSVQGELSATAVSGDGSGLTSVDAATLAGFLPADFAADPHDHAGEFWFGAYAGPLLDLTNSCGSGSSAYAIRGTTDSSSGSGRGVASTQLRRCRSRAAERHHHHFDPRWGRPDPRQSLHAAVGEQFCRLQR